MVKPDLRIEGDEELARVLGQIASEGNDELDKMLAKVAVNAQGEAIELIQEQQSRGRVYKRGDLTHVASEPGNPPNTDSSDLASSIFFVRKRKNFYRVGNRKRKAPHGFWLEFGTRFMAKRPWLTPAFNKTVDKFFDNKPKLKRFFKNR